MKIFQLLGMKGIPDILLTLEGRELNFTGIKEKVDVSNGWLHKALSILETEGLITAEARLDTNGRAVKLYRLTEDGKISVKLLHNIIEKFEGDKRKKQSARKSKKLMVYQ